MFALDHLESADAAADVNTDLFGHLGRYFQPSGSYREFSRRHRELYEAAHLLNIFFVDILKRVKILDLPGDATGEFGCVELGDVLNPVLRLTNRRPTLLGPGPNSTDQPDSSNNYSSRQGYFFLASM